MSALTYQPNAQSAPGPVEFALATVILTRGWTGATLNWDSSQSALIICQGEQCLETLLPDHSK
jgi:hypothetical protein